MCIYHISVFFYSMCVESESNVNCLFDFVCGCVSACVIILFEMALLSMHVYAADFNIFVFLRHTFLTRWSPHYQMIAPHSGNCMSISVKCRPSFGMG